MKKICRQLLFIPLIAIFGSCVKAEVMIDLTAEDLFIRSGFDEAWIKQTPSLLVKPSVNIDISENIWIKIDAVTDSNRSVNIPYLISEKRLVTPSSETIQTFTIVTSFRIKRSADANPFLSLFLSTIGDNWAVYLNGHLIRSEIFLDRNGAILKHRFLRDVVIPFNDLHLQDGKNILAFKIIGDVNYDATGLYASQSYLVGDYLSLIDKQNNVSSIVLSFTYLIIGVFFFFMYLRRTKGLYNLMFALSCFSLFAYLISRTALIQDYITESITITKLEYISLYLFSAMSLLFIDTILGYKISKMAKSFLIYILLLVGITYMSEGIVADKVLSIWQMSSLFSICYLLFYRIIWDTFSDYRSFSRLYLDRVFVIQVLLKIKKVLFETIAGNLVIGTLIVSIASAVDIINSIVNGSGIFGVKYGFFIFMISNTAVLINKFVTAQTQAEDLTANLEEKVKTRTKSLEVVNHDLAVANEKALTMMNELEKARDEAKQSNSAKGEFLANMSHEIRTPINGVIGMLEMLGDTKLTNKQRELQGIASNSAGTLLNLINDILDFSKIEAGKLELESNIFDFRKSILLFNSMVQREIEEKGVLYYCRVDESIPKYLKADPNRLRQILVNLASNAKKFTSKGSITISIDMKNKYTDYVVLLFTIKDTGIGISNAQQKKLFNKFSQADKSTTRQYGGTGLGLAISKQLVEAMNGKIGLNSVEGKGSEFWFSCQLNLPTAKQLEQFESEQINHTPLIKKTSANRKILASSKILVAEDNKVNQIVIKGFLNKLGINPHIVENGALALEQLKLSKFDLVFMDLQMPVMDGLNATLQIRNGAGGEENKNVIIIAATANAMKGDIDRCLAAGMNDYLSKPIIYKELKQLVYHALLGKSKN